MERSIRFGYCCSPEETALYAEAGFDFFECNASAVLCQDDYKERIANAALPCLSANCFIPGNLKITGKNVDRAALMAHAEKVITRAGECGIPVIVFGSGGARDVPEGFSVENAAAQILDFVRDLIPVLEKSGVTLVLEPLGIPDSNIINSVGAGAALVNRVDHPNMKLLADSYHFYKSDNALESLAWNAPHLRHIHVATSPDRLAPGMQEWDLTEFFSVLKHSGYSCGISVECFGGADKKTEAETAIAVLRKTWDAID
ncbi:MAG: sugar phosphate isomerase/epimerase [Lentisphaeria bacterium]|nr:sugar phosphate isomerase/epimerase [Lentisphaeria bacterium]